MAKDTEGNEIVEITEDNAADVAREEIKTEALENETPDEKAERIAKEDKEEEKEEEKEEDKKEDEKEDDKKDDKDDKKEEDKEEELTDEQKEAEQVERKRLLDTDDKDLKPEEIENKKTVLLQLETEEKEAFDVRVADYAKEKDLPADEARSTLESVVKIANKYEKDPDKIAEANLGLQRLVSQKDEEIRAVREESNQPQRPQTAKEWELRIKENGLVTSDGKAKTWEGVVESYREANADTTENLEDEQVLKLVSKEIHTKSEVYFEKQKLEAKTKADEKRTKLVSGLGEENKSYSAEVKEILKTVPNAIILREDFDIEHSVNWARGKHFTPKKVAELLKEAEEKGFSRGQVKGKIVTGIIGKGNVPKKKGAVSGTPAQIDEAWEMFPDAKDEAEALANYLDVEKDRKKNKK